MPEIKPLEYHEAINEYGKLLLDDLRKFDKLEKEGKIHRSEIDRIMIGLIEARIYAIAQVVSKQKIHDFKKRYNIE